MLSFSRYLVRLALVRRFGKNTSGTTIIEFAMVVPLFMLLLGIVLETGVMMFTEYVLQTSVQEAARLVRTGQAQTMELNVTTFKNKVCRIASLLINCNSKVTVYMKPAASFSALADPTNGAASYLTVGIKADGVTDLPTFSCGSANQVVALIATYDYKFVIPYFMKYFGNFDNKNTRRMAGFAMFRNEPFPTTSKVCVVSP